MSDGGPGRVVQPGMDEVRGLEERAFNAWPALQTLIVDGWLLRLAGGYTKRANSINAWMPRRDIQGVLDVARPIYSRGGQALIVRVTPLSGVHTDAALERLGFTRADETIVMTMPVRPGACDARVRVENEPSPDWLAGFAKAQGYGDQKASAHTRLLRAVRVPTGYATVVVDGAAVCWGIGAIERGSVGLFDIVTAPGWRRTGLGRQLVAGLLRWAEKGGACTAYLQVAAENGPAIRLYASLGFAEAYRYHYRLETAEGPSNR